MLVTGLFLIIVISSGMRLTYLFDPDASAPARLAMGFVLGLSGAGLIGFGLASLFGLTPMTLVLTMLLALAPCTLPKSQACLARFGRDLLKTLDRLRARPLAALHALAWAVFLVILFDRAFFMRPDGLYTGDNHNLGDLPFHLSITSGFLHGENFPPEHPELMGARLTYPFLVDFIPALWMRGGASFRAAFFVESALLALALLVLLRHWAYRLTRDCHAAALIPWLAFLSGGLGFTMLVNDWASRGGSLAQLFTLLAQAPHDYTILHPAYAWGNALLTLFIPQRAFLLGLPLFLIAATLIADVLLREREAGPDAAALHRLTAAGVAAGLLPLAHSHSFAILMATAVGWALLFPDLRLWRRFFYVAGAIALPQMIYSMIGSSVRAGSFLAWQPGWDRGQDNALVFWWRNVGLVLPLLWIALCWRGRRPIVAPPLARLLAPFAIWIIVPNLLRLSPWIWDNIKFLYYGYLAACVPIALLLSRIRRWPYRIGFLLAPLLLVALTLSGMLDLLRVVTRTTEQRIFTSEGLAFAALIRGATAPRAVVLHRPTYNTPVLLTGRRSVLGYPGHIPSQGLDAGQREQEIQRIYSGAADALALLDRYDVDFIVVGPHEREGLEVNDAFLRRFEWIGNVGEYELYRASRR